MFRIYYGKQTIFFVELENKVTYTEQGSTLLTEFQQAKFRHFFYHVLDLNSDHVISQVGRTGFFPHEITNWPDKLYLFSGDSPCIAPVV